MYVHLYMFTLFWCNYESNLRVAEAKNGLVRESNPGPLAPKARIMPLDQQAFLDFSAGIYPYNFVCPVNH